MMIAIKRMPATARNSWAERILDSSWTCKIARTKAGRRNWWRKIRPRMCLLDIWSLLMSSIRVIECLSWKHNFKGVSQLLSIKGSSWRVFVRCRSGSTITWMSYMKLRRWGENRLLDQITKYLHVVRNTRIGLNSGDFYLKKRSIWWENAMLYCK